MTGLEAKTILQENGINLSELAAQLNISPQAFSSRLNAQLFKKSYQLEINQALKRSIFDVSKDDEFRQPILDIRICAGNGIGLEGDENKVIEYVNIPSLSGCIGMTVYGESMYPQYKPGDVIFVRPVTDKYDIDFGQTFLVITHSDRLLKMLYESDKGPDYLRLSSYNIDTKPDGERLYPDRDIPVDNILFIYKVVGSLQRKQM
jgi:phage repressor protein C with HTH and peptisase S24 domain